MKRRTFISSLAAVSAAFFAKGKKGEATTESTGGLPVLRFDKNGNLTNLEELMVGVPFEQSNDAPWGMNDYSRQAVLAWLPKQHAAMVDRTFDRDELFHGVVILERWRSESVILRVTNQSTRWRPSIRPRFDVSAVGGLLNPNGGRYNNRSYEIYVC